MKRGLLVAAMLLHAGCAPTQPLTAPGTTADERARFKQRLIHETIEGALARELTPATAKSWHGALWGMGLARYRSESARTALRKACGTFFTHSLETHRALLEAIYALYPDDFVAETEGIMLAARNEKIFAMAALHFVRATGWNEIPRTLEAMSRRFHRNTSHPILRMLEYELRQIISDQPPLTPPVHELLAAPLAGKPVLFSLQRKDRRYPGMAVLRKSDGTFARVADSALFMVPQLALASSNLPGYLTNGNTPQGIFSVQGFDVSDNQFIGPTLNVQMVMPFEANPALFFHDKRMKGNSWGKELYDALLADSWRGYMPIYTSYYAGEAGRTEIIAHGTTVDPAFSEGEPYYPSAPTLGCLSASELWSEVNGARLRSDQQVLIDMMKSIGFTKGFCVVVEIDDKREPVSRREVGLLINEAENLKR